MTFEFGNFGSDKYNEWFKYAMELCAKHPECVDCPLVGHKPIDTDVDTVLRCETGVFNGKKKSESESESNDEGAGATT